MSNITLQPKIFGVSLNFSQIGQVSAPSAVDCKGTTVTVSSFTYATFLPNGQPDMTIADVRAWWPKILEVEPSLAAIPIEMVSSGTGEPLIDLSAVSEELNTAAADADLMILEGMGRGVESNLEAEFSCDSVNIAMIKDVAVAHRHGGKVFDVVCQFRPAKTR